MAILTSSQLTFVDITDQRKLSAYITSNLTTIQIKDSDVGTFSPDWSTTNLVLTPNIFLDQETVSLFDPNLEISWRRKEGNNTETSITTNESVTDKILTINANKLDNTQSGMLTYICNVTYRDEELGTTANITSQLTYTLVKTASDAKTCSISGPQIFKYDTNGSLVGDSQITLIGTTQSVSIVQWQYYDPTTSQYKPYPTTVDNAAITNGTLNVKPSHTIFNSAGVAKIKLVTNDNDVFDIITISKLYDGLKGGQGDAGQSAYTIFLTNESYTFPGTTNSAKSDSVETEIVIYKGVTQQTPTIKSVDGKTTANGNTNTTGLSYSVNGANVIFTSSTSLVESSGSIPIVVTVDGQNFTKYFSWSVAYTGATGEGACSLSITASSQIFKSSDGQTYTPNKITLTPIPQNLNLSDCKWEYSDDGGITYKAITSSVATVSSEKVLTLSNASAAFTNITSLVFKCSTNDNEYYDTMTVSKLTDGKSASAAYTVVLSNEAQGIPTDTSLYPLSAASYDCNVVVYEGTNKLNPTKSTPGDGQFRVVLPSNPVGITLAQNTAGVVTLSVSKDVQISSSGNIDLTIQIEGTSNTLTKSISYYVSKSGTSGTSPVVFSVYAPNGTVFSNQSGQLILATSAYYGSLEIGANDANYAWYKFSNGSWGSTPIATTSQYTVYGEEVANIASYKCIMTYPKTNGKQYTDVITLEDKSDTCVSEMLTIGGTTFKNGQGGSGVYVVIRSNGAEIDPLGGRIGTSYPDQKSLNDYFYLVDHTNKTISQKKWNGSSWVNTTIPQEKTYTWSLMDKDGNVQDFHKAGKVIYLSCDDIHSIGTLQCEVTNS